MTGDENAVRRVSTGVDGLDAVLHGGLIAGRGYMIRGEPGTGKSILGQQFLAEGAANGESTLYVHLEESRRDIRENAAQLGIDLSSVEFVDLSPQSADFTDLDSAYDVFEPSDVNRERTLETLTDHVADRQFDRVFVDPITHLRYVLRNDYQFTTFVSGFVEHLSTDDSTLLFTAQSTAVSSDEDVQYLSDGVIELTRNSFGRRLEIPKLRGSQMMPGSHGVRITDSGLVVFPSVRPGSPRQRLSDELISSGVPRIDALLGGGIEAGTVTIISGPSGVGKTTLAASFMAAAAERGDHSAIYHFDESEDTFSRRCSAIGIPIERLVDEGRLGVHDVEPLDLSPQEFASLVRDDIDANDTNVVLLDGIAGYRLSLRGSDASLQTELHSLVRYLRNNGITVFLADATQSVTGDFKPTERNVSYLADNIMFLRYLEIESKLRKAIGVLKKRGGPFEHTLREFAITERGIEVGEPMSDLQGILSGMPSINDTQPDPEER